ncbi:alpha/beta fold hydrolase [Fluviicola taffensis]|uniref:Membrane-associated esterase n=1 Tax=Fluviicola taffensis (strain DSM 16823 / NCIMB 13979 / RW262) TaxID=755732 RepID=F2IB46_FLUTR|nr:alpha/beta hydrolase [Fluviicola taffensis]AEA42129.1 membrane-associated esterase [Fluviicola taffensis DSM 16823]
MLKQKKNRFFVVLGGILILAIAGFASMSSETESISEKKINKKQREILVEEYEVFDNARFRRIPVALYAPKVDKDSTNTIQLVIFSHGYGSNYPTNYTNYSYLTRRLAGLGYWTLSIQHELIGDSLLPKVGVMQEVRMPFWKRGEENILFVLNHFKEIHPNLFIKSVDLIGHSNGGDMSVLMAKDYPNLIRKVITLDHLRIPFPLTFSPQYSSLRSTDKTADSGVIPSPEMCDSLGIQIIQLRRITHNEMNDEGTRRQKKKINGYIQKILENRL